MLKGLSVPQEKRSATVTIMVTPAVRAKIQAIATSEDRSLSKVASALLERGLDAYRKDGLLKTGSGDGKLGVIRVPAEEPVRKKNRQ